MRQQLAFFPAQQVVFTDLQTPISSSNFKVKLSLNLNLNLNSRDALGGSRGGAIKARKRQWKSNESLGAHLANQQAV